MGKAIAEFLEGLIFDIADGEFFFEQLQVREVRGGKKERKGRKE